MKKTLLSLTQIFLVTSLIGQVRIVSVDPVADQFTLQNYGASMVDVSGHQVCALFDYNAIGGLAIISGSTMLMPGSSVTFTGFALDDNGSDLGYYLTGAFNDTASMQDFVQWGSAGNGRESVAASKGIWTAGDFLTTTGPFIFIGDGQTDYGAMFWQISLGVNDINDVDISLYPNPTNGMVFLQLSGNSQVRAVRVFDMAGSLVIEQLVQAGIINQLSLEGLQRGAYLVDLSGPVENYRRMVMLH